MRTHRGSRRRLIGQDVFEIGSFEVCFPNKGSGVAGFPQRITQNRDGFAQVYAMVEHLVASLRAPRDHAGARRHTDGIGRVHALESQALPSDAVHRRRTYRRVLEAHCIPPLLVRRNKQEIRPGPLERRFRHVNFSPLIA